MAAIARLLLAGLFLVMASACARPASLPQASLPQARQAPEGTTIVVEMPAAGPEVLAVARRWRPSDVFHYTVRLTRWNGTAFVDLPQPLEVVLPKRTSPLMQVRFTNLAQGRRYRATVIAWGNAGGTAPSVPLNALSPSVADFDLSAAQDVQDALWRVSFPMLDPVPFNGKAVIVPLGAPAGVQTYDLELATASGLVVFRGTFDRRQTMTVTNLKAGTAYKVSLAARRGNGAVSATTSAPLSWDERALELEQDVTLELRF